MNNFDVIIIGGGPSGAMAGIELQRHGFNTCIIDKASFPRDKLCGGGITQKTLNLLASHCSEINTSDYILGQTHNVDFYHKTTKITSATMTDPCYFTDRKLLDNCLIRLYRDKGGTLLENRRIASKDINFRANEVKYGTETFTYRFLIGATGCSTVFTKPFHIKRNDFFCMEAKIPKTTPDNQPCRIYFGAIRIGYGWLFPKNDHDVLGIGGEDRNKQLHKEAVRLFNEATDKPYQPPKGALIPSGRKVNALSVNHNTLLTGDAAGFIDPLTGEGLYYALLSGIYAASSIDEAVRTDTDKLTGLYASKCREIRQNMKWGFWLIRILYSKPVMRYFVKALQIHSNFVTYYLEEMMSNYRKNYKNFIWDYFTTERNKQK
jgi:geranylgeranyl reductase family protein